jgi:hypothetical protein
VRFVLFTPKLLGVFEGRWTRPWRAGDEPGAALGRRGGARTCSGSSPRGWRGPPRPLPAPQPWRRGPIKWPSSSDELGPKRFVGLAGPQEHAPRSSSHQVAITELPRRSSRRGRPPTDAPIK